MTHDCADGNMRDRLPGYVHGTLSAGERATVAAHLESCEDCAAEVELIVTASRALPARRIDVAKIVKALPAAPRGARRGVFAGSLFRIAAAIGAVAIGAFSVIALRGFFSASPKQTAAVPIPVPVVAPTVVAAAAAPTPAAIGSRAQSSEPAVAKTHRGSGISFGGGLSDLTDDQLDTLLGELDALEALPSAEPETHLSPIVPQADGGHSAR